MTGTISFGLTGNALIDGVSIGDKWATTALTHSFAASTADYAAG